MKYISSYYGKSDEQELILIFGVVLLVSVLTFVVIFTIKTFSKNDINTIGTIINEFEVKNEKCYLNFVKIGETKSMNKIISSIEVLNDLCEKD